MAQISNYDFPTDYKYIFIEPISLFWAKREENKNQSAKSSILLGFTELMTKTLNHNELKFTFRSESLMLRKNKPFLRLLTKNKMFEFLSPWKCDWEINPMIKQNDFSFLDYPYNQYVIKCFNIQGNVDEPLTDLPMVEHEITKIIDKESFKDCKDCPDFFQSSVTRRL